MDIAGLSAVSVVWPVSATARSTTTDTATGSTGNDSTGLADRGRPGDNPTRATARPVDPDLPTGPPPTFSTTPLELEGDWQVLLARISAAGYAQMQAMAPPSDSAPGGGGAPGGAPVAAKPADIARPPQVRTASPASVTPPSGAPQTPVSAKAAPSAPAGAGGR